MRRMSMAAVVHECANLAGRACLLAGRECPILAHTGSCAVVVHHAGRGERTYYDAMVRPLAAGHHRAKHACS